MLSNPEFFSCKSNSANANVHLSVHPLPKPLSLSELLLSTIEPIDHQAYWPSSLSTIKPINHQVYRPSNLATIKPINHKAYQPSSLLTSGLLLRLLSLLACFCKIPIEFSSLCSDISSSFEIWANFSQYCLYFVSCRDKNPLHYKIGQIIINF